jgi:hypothetical protein
MSQYRFRALLKEYFHFFSKLFAIVLFASDGSFRSLRFALFNPRAIRPSSGTTMGLVLEVFPPLDPLPPLLLLIFS